jgi:hypothetical protein
MRHQRLLRFLFFLPLRAGVFLYAIATARSPDLNRNSPLHILVSILLFLAPLVEDRTLMVPWLMVYGAEFVYLFPWDCCPDSCSSWNYWRELILFYGLLVTSSYYLLLKDIEEGGPIDLGSHWVPTGPYDLYDGNNNDNGVRAQDYSADGQQQQMEVRSSQAAVAQTDYEDGEYM